MFSFIQYFDVVNNDCSNNFPVCIKFIFQSYISEREVTVDIKIWCSDKNIFFSLLQNACSDQVLTQF